MVFVTVYRLYNPVYTELFDDVAIALAWCKRFKNGAKFATGEYSVGVSPA